MSRHSTQVYPDRKPAQQLRPPSHTGSILVYPQMTSSMKTVLDNNTITFNGIHYIQTEGMAIGSHLGINYASTYIGSWEKKLFRGASRHPIAYLRFVDDVWGLWTHGAEALEEFFNVGN